MVDRLFQYAHIRHRGLLLYLVFSCAIATLQAQSDEPVAGEQSTVQLVRRYAIHSIRFVIQPDSIEGIIPSDNELLSAINSRACDFSMTSRLLRSLTYESMAHKGVPSGIVTTLTEFYTRSSQNELRYFDKTIAGVDVYLLQDYFTQLGYHDVRVRYVFTVSRDQRDNKLQFFITTHRQYKLDTVVVDGVHTLPESVRDRVLAIPNRSALSTFNEPNLSFITNAMLGILHDSGYAFARLPQLPDPDQPDTSLHRIVSQSPIVYIDTVRKCDSVTIFLEPQRRFVFGTIRFIDSTHGYPFVVNSLKQQQLEYKTGEWYNLSAVRRSEMAINALGPFDRVAIDTTSSGDTIHTTVFTSYRRNWELRPSLFLNNTFPDNLNNFGIDVNYLNRNLFHDAQVLNLYGRWTIRNIDYVVYHGFRTNLDQEYETGFLYSQPDFTRLFGKRIDGSLQVNYSYRAIVDPLKLHTLNLRLSPFALFSNNLARLQVDGIIEAQLPRNFEGSYEAAYQQIRLKNPNLDTTNLRQYLNERLDPYKKLDTYTEQGQRFKLTSFVIAANYFMDQRNDVFFPSHGYTLNVIGEVTPIGLLTNFVRTLGTFTTYHALSPSTVQAFKVRLGHIIWFNRGENIVPSDRHFFAGGATSIRSFVSRKLGNPASDDPNLPSDVGDLANYVGWASIVELSAEFRFTFPYYADLGEFLADKISRLGITFFVDAGNAFNRLTPTAYGKAGLTDVLSPVNWALAAGAGIRFATPVGPARLDFGLNVYDPTVDHPRYQWIFNRSFYDAISAQIGLGHAF